MAVKKVAFITGGSSGIGLDLAKHLHGKGWRVAISARQSERGQNAAQAIDASGETAMFVQCDVSSYAQQAAAFKAVWDRWGRLDAFVANAGITDTESKYNLRRRDAAVDDLPPEPSTQTLDIDLRAVIHGTVLATHFMRHNTSLADGKTPSPGGKMVVTASGFAVYPGDPFPEYAAAKAGALHWVRSTAATLLAKENMTINAVIPGPYDTKILPGFQDSFLPEHLVKLETLLEAYTMFIEDAENKRNGQAAEVEHDEIGLHEPTKALLGSASQRLLYTYEPWYEGLHGEKSGFPGAIQGIYTEEEKEASRQRLAARKTKTG